MAHVRSVNRHKHAFSQAITGMMAGVRWLALMLVGCGFQPSPGTLGSDARLADAVDAKPDRPIDARPDAAIPIGFVQVADHQTSSGSTTTTATSFASAQAAGDLEVVVLSWVGGATAIAVADGTGNTYVSLGAVSNGGVSQAVAYAANISSAAATNTITATFGVNVSNPTIRAVEYTGIAAAPFDISATASGSSVTPSGDVTTTHAHDLIYVAETSNNATATGPGSGYVERVIFDGDLVEDREVMTAGAVHADLPLNPSAAWIIMLVGFKGAS